MTPARTNGKSGAYQFDRVFRGVGQIKCSSGVFPDRWAGGARAALKEFQRRDAVLTKLFENSQLEILAAFRDGKLTIEQLVDADRADRTLATLDEVKLAAPLWDAIEQTLPKMGKKAPTRARYQVSLRSLQLKAHASLGDAATVAQLADVDWRALHGAWGKSESDWNRMGSAVSAFLTVFLDEKYHPFRRKVRRQIEIGDEGEGRVPDVSPTVFARIISHVHADLRAPFIALAATGLRVGEYLQLRAEHLRPVGCRVLLPGGKSGSAFVEVDPSLWPFVAAAVPCPLGPSPLAPIAVQLDIRYKRLWRIWKQARTKAKVTELTLHDLRLCYGQWGVDAGGDERHAQAAMRHKDPKMTRRYTQTRDRATFAKKVAGVLMPALKKKKLA